MTTFVDRRTIPLKRVISDEVGGIEAHGRNAPFALRCGAALIDYIAVVGIAAFGTIVSRMLGGGGRVIGGTAQIIGFLAAIGFLVINFVLLAGFNGQTLGKWATGLRIERDDDAHLGIGHALLRHFVGYPISFLTLGLGFVLAIFNSREKGLHDIIAGTIVVREGVSRRRGPRS
jgi:uncharacterized RDD family membrane protein YckC